MSDVNTIPKILGTNIRSERIRQGFSQEKLAEKSGLHRTYIGMVERGEKNITVINYVKITSALSLPLPHLLTSLGRDMG